jgi:hypothetical protein
MSFRSHQLVGRGCLYDWFSYSSKVGLTSFSYTSDIGRHGPGRGWLTVGNRPGLDPLSLSIQPATCVWHACYAFTNNMSIVKYLMGKQCNSRLGSVLGGSVTNILFRVGRSGQPQPQVFSSYKVWKASSRKNSVRTTLIFHFGSALPPNV